MDGRVGAGIRAARVRRGWRQADLGSAARVSTTTVSRIERGAFDVMPVRTVRAVAGALGLGVEVRLRSRDGDIDRLVNSRHAALAEAVVGWSRRFEGWTARPEVSFNVFGERGSIDVVLWHASTRTVIVIELKTEIVDVGELLATFDRKIRLAGPAVAPLGWRPVSVGAALIVAESSTNRRHVGSHAATFRAALPDSIVVLRAALRSPGAVPSGNSARARPSSAGQRPPSAGRHPLRALIFFSDNHHRNVRTPFASVRRVRRRSPSSPEHGSERSRGDRSGTRGSSGP